ncbi:sensor domain-containing diguanylate cyclase [Sphingomonas aquatilis]|uniref:sensor domain-containing diguanylate cyclase n=1 Tax=Sphingomonas aquatilis TaxID=93063 RepID=UPI0023F8F005|nr:sensor domain-containing diguanylate cyclase [Sphingomonas aquatilis]MCI4654282.1 sensor domain-containing diguanylate cyclase [Sphingomonas aquatilis]
MNDAVLPPQAAYDEAGRLAALHALNLLDSEPEREFDAVVALAAELRGCPTALISLVDRERIWVKAMNAPGPNELGRNVAMCDRTVRQNELMVITDMTLDAHYRTSPVVTDAGNRFYAGVPIHVVDGQGVTQPIGTLCVLDVAPRSLNAAGEAALRHLGTLAEVLIAARRNALEAIRIATTGEQLVRDLARQDKIFRQAERIARIGSWRLSLGDSQLEWSENVFRIHGVPSGDQPPLSKALEFYPPYMRDQISETISRTVRTGEPFDFESALHTADGRLLQVRAAGEAERGEDGSVQALVGVFQDITERHRLETQLRRSADTDALTGIANRAAFDRELDAAMTRARTDGSPLMLMLIDLDGFKAINDALGHDAGDDVLRLTGAALTQPWLRDCFAARIGGDEFALIVTAPALIADPERLCRGLEAALRVPVTADGITMTSAGSIGHAMFDTDCHSLRDFARRADAMLYAEKRKRIGRTPTAQRRAG